jgi:hypothetical protein
MVLAQAQDHPGLAVSFDPKGQVSLQAYFQLKGLWSIFKEEANLFCTLSMVIVLADVGITLLQAGQAGAPLMLLRRRSLLLLWSHHGEHLLV